VLLTLFNPSSAAADSGLLSPLTAYGRMTGMGNGNVYVGD